jgi:4-alpha-glucanotransferase
MPRRAGITIPLFSLRTSAGWGVGEIPDLVPMARWGRAAGFEVLQLLPVNEAAHGQSSPYFARTAFAVDPVFLRLEDVEDFAAAGGVGALPAETRATLESLGGGVRVDWQRVRALKREALQLAFRRFVEREWKAGGARAAELSRYAGEQAHWLDDYALFSAIGEAWNGGGGWGGWDAWPAPLRDRDPAALDEARRAHGERLLYHRYVQWQLDRQWRDARWKVGELGVTLMGDLPFMVAGDSSDVWQRAGEFQLDASIGAPPDAFSAEGQDWGLPVFRWELMKGDDYRWMRERAGRAAELFGLYRIDHVVGLFRTWFILADKKTKGFVPADEPAQLAQGVRLLEILKNAGGPVAPGAPSPVIAEDLGVVPDFVRAALTRLGVPGYRVLRWETDGPIFRDPAHYPAVSVATTSTHDTDSLADWYDGLSDDARRHFLEIPGLAALRATAPARFSDPVRDAILELVYRSGSDLVLLPFQDLFGHRDRVNVPGTVNADNWCYRMPRSIDDVARDAPGTARLAALQRLR